MRNSYQRIVHSRAVLRSIGGPYGEDAGSLRHQDVPGNAVSDVDRVVMRYSFRGADFGKDRRIWFCLMQRKLDDFFHWKTGEPVFRRWMDRGSSFSAINSRKKLEKPEPIESV